MGEILNQIRSELMTTTYEALPYGADLLEHPDLKRMVRTAEAHLMARISFSSEVFITASSAD